MADANDPSRFIPIIQTDIYLWICICVTCERCKRYQIKEDAEPFFRSLHIIMKHNHVTILPMMYFLGHTKYNNTMPCFTSYYYLLAIYQHMRRYM